MIGKMKLLASCAILMVAVGCSLSGGCKDDEVCDKARTVTNSECQFIVQFPAGWSSALVKVDHEKFPTISNFIDARAGDAAIDMTFFCSNEVGFTAALTLEDWVVFNSEAIVPDGVTPDPPVYFTTAAGQEAGGFEYYDPSDGVIKYYAYIRYPSSATFPMYYVDVRVEAGKDVWADWKDGVIEIIKSISIY
jgi:hypothetical protein